MNPEVTSSTAEREAMIDQSTCLPADEAQRVNEACEGTPGKAIGRDRIPSSGVGRLHRCHPPRSRNYAMTESDARHLLIQLEHDLTRGPGEPRKENH
jgi:hypothetical protein